MESNKKVFNFSNAELEEQYNILIKDEDTQLYLKILRGQKLFEMAQNFLIDDNTENKNENNKEN